MTQGSKRWTKEEENRLLFLVGHFRWPTVLRRFPGRTEAAIRIKLHKLGMGIRRAYSSRGTLIGSEYGYSRSQVARAEKAAGIARRLGRVTWYSESEFDRLLRYLADEPQPYLSKDGNASRTWSRRWDRCASCGTSGTAPAERHHFNGECVRCARRRMTFPRCPTCEARIWTVSRLVESTRRRRKQRQACGGSGEPTVMPPERVRHTGDALHVRPPLASLTGGE